MRIDYVNKLNIQGLSVQKALDALCKRCNEDAELIMKMNNDIEDLKIKIYRLEND